MKQINYYRNSTFQENISTLNLVLNLSSRQDLFLINRMHSQTELVSYFVAWNEKLTHILKIGNRAVKCDIMKDIFLERLFVGF